MQISRGVSNTLVALKFDTSLIAHITFDMNLDIEHNDTFQNKLDLIAGIVKVTQLTCNVLMRKSV
jgi:hypothetical protein